MAIVRLIEDLWRDVRYGARVLLHNPLFAAVAMTSIALGIGGAASVFTVMNAVLLRDLPVAEAPELFAVKRVLGPDREGTQYGWPQFEQARRELDGRAELCAFTRASGMQVQPDAATRSTPERGMVQFVSGEYFSLLRQQPQAGRLLHPGDNVEVDGHAVAVISDAFWTKHFSRSPGAIGRQIVVNGASLTIVGVAARGFFGPVVAFRNPDIWVPLMMQHALRYAANASTDDGAEPQKPWPPQPNIEWLTLLARVPGGDATAAATAMTVLHQRDATSRLGPDATEDDRRTIAGQTVVLDPAAHGISDVRENLGRPLFALLGIVGVLLMIACGNLASLLLSRANAREREMAIRLSIGAGRRRVIRQLLAETLLLSAVGGALGLLLAAWGRDFLLTMFSTSAVIDLNTAFDWRVLAFVVGLTLLTGIAAGVGPALHGTRIPLAETMKAQSRSVGAAGLRGAMVGKVLVAAQIAFCLLLLVLAALFTRSMQSLLQIEVGYDRDALLVARLDVRSMGYSEAQREALYARLLDRVRALPGVAAASLSLNGPMGTSRRISSLTVEGYTPGPDERLQTQEEVITDRYFETVGLKIVEGRGFTAADRAPGANSTVINQTMAKRFFPTGTAIGKRWSYGETIDADARVIVGVVEDAKYLDVRRAASNMAYQLSAASPEEVLSNLEVRTTLPPSRLVETLKKTLHEAEPTLPVFDVVPLEVRLTRGIFNDRLVARLATTFSLVALFLACLGLYGTISYGVTRRVTELGVRMALGAARANVLWLVIREASILVIAGTLVGVPLAYLAGRSAASLLYGVEPLDLTSYALAAAALMAVAGLAAFLPAHRASRIDPMVALRRD